jgi:hypothetical protein
LIVLDHNSVRQVEVEPGHIASARQGDGNFFVPESGG